MILDANSDGSFTKYLNGLGIDDKLSLKSNGVTNYFTQDHLGSTNALTDASGNVISSTSYDSFGNATGNLSTRYTYTGREYDADTNLYYYRARFYDSKLGRFISEDPIGFAGGDINLFGYVGENPLNFKDPTGMYWDTNAVKDVVKELPKATPILPVVIVVAKPVAVAVAGLAAGYAVGYYAIGKPLSEASWNPFVNGPLNPFGTSASEAEKADKNQSCPASKPKQTTSSLPESRFPPNIDQPTSDRFPGEPSTSKREKGERCPLDTSMSIEVGKASGKGVGSCCVYKCKLGFVPIPWSQIKGACPASIPF